MIVLLPLDFLREFEKKSIGYVKIKVAETFLVLFFEPMKYLD